MSVTSINGDDGSNTLVGGAGQEVIYRFDPAGPQSQASTISATRVAIGLSAPLFAVAPRNDPSRLFLNAPLHPSFSALRSPCMPPSGSVRFSFTPGSSPFVNSTPASQRVLGHLHAGVLHRLGARDRDLEDRPVRLALEAHSGVDGGGVEAERARRRCGRW